MRILLLLLVCGAAGSAQDFAELKKLYAYDPAAPLAVKLTQTDKRTGYSMYAISYALPNGERTDGFLAVPDGRSRKAAVVWMHSSGALAWIGDVVAMAQAGAVSLIVNAPGGVQGESAEGDRDAMIAAVVALRRAADVLAARDDVDPKRIGIAGHSFGAMMAAVAASIDPTSEPPRFAAAVFEVGLLGMSVHIGTSPHPWAQGVRKQIGAGLPHYLETISVVDAGRYIGHAPAIPKLFQSAWYDPGVPHEDSTKFFAAATGPKTMQWYDTAHDIDDIGAMADRLRFFAKTLGLPRAEAVIAAKAGRKR